MNCCVVNCNNNRIKTAGLNLNISYYKFPKNEALRLDWVIFTGREFDWAPKVNSSICSEHFEESCFNYKNGKRYLKTGSIPSIKESNGQFTIGICQKLFTCEHCLGRCDEDEIENASSQIKQLMLKDFRVRQALRKYIQKPTATATPENKDVLKLQRTVKKLQRDVERCKSLAAAKDDTLKKLKEKYEETKGNIVNNQLQVAHLLCNLQNFKEEQ